VYVYPRDEEVLDSRAHDEHAGGRDEVGRTPKIKWNRGRCGEDQLDDAGHVRHPSYPSGEGVEGVEVLTEHQDRIRFMKPRQVEEVGSYGK
jgi:hypothetical protein